MGTITDIAKFGEGVELKVDKVEAGDKPASVGERLSGQRVRVMPIYISLGVFDYDQMRWLRQLEVGKKLTIGVRIRKGDPALYYYAHPRLQWKHKSGDPVYVLSLMPGQKPADENRFIDKGAVIPDRLKPRPFDPDKVRGGEVDESKIKHTLTVGGEGDYDTIAAAVARAKALLKQGQGVRIRIGAGVWREGPFVFHGKQLSDAPIVIEGDPDGRTILTGADRLTGKWSRQQVGDVTVWSHPWPHDFGPRAMPFKKHSPWTDVSHRSEMVFIDGRMPRPVALEAYDWNPSRDQPGSPGRGTHTYQRYLGPEVLVGEKYDKEFGTFGVAERDDNGNRLFIAPPPGVDPAKAEVEAAVRGSGLQFVGKKNIVIRDLVLERFRGRGLSLFRCQNIVIERVTSRWNNEHGVGLGWFRHATFRDVNLHHNGQLGMITGTGSDGLIWENVTTNHNAWRAIMGGQAGWYIGGIKYCNVRNAIFRNQTSIGNFTWGHWADILCANVLVEDSVFFGNRRGMHIETGDGPFELRRSIVAGSAGVNLLVWNQPDATITDSIFYASNRIAPLRLYTRWRMHHNIGFVKAFGEAPELITCITGPTRIAGCVMLQSKPGAPVFQFVQEQFDGGASNAKWHPSLEPLAEYARTSYRGRDNLFHAPHAKAIAYIDWRTMTLAEFLKRQPGEQGAQWADPGFVDPANGDFRLKPDSPIAKRAGALPVRSIDPEAIKEMHRMRRWVGEIPDPPHKRWAK